MKNIGRSTVDWEAVKAEYITTRQTMRELAEKYGIEESGIRRRSSAEGWVQARKDYRSSIVEKTTARLGDEAAERMVRLMDSTERVLAAAEQALTDTQQFNRHLVQVSSEGEKYTEEQTFKKVDTKAMKEMTTVLKDLTALTRDLYGLPDKPQEKQVIEVVFNAGDEEWNE
ncbi:MAG: hypothetical protein J6J04_06365 [Oscillospiraceae bacterium]|nr:hypothetical protein [Oscillospiraceae bacterium]